MMLMSMRPQKEQLASLYKYTVPGNYNFTIRNLALMFGYTRYRILVVGACGGRSGTASRTGQTTRYGSGGGGGASQLLDGLISSLTTNEAVVVGAVGTTGANGASGANSGAGGRGGTSQFGFLSSAPGGYGGYAANAPNIANKGGEGSDISGGKATLGGMEGVSAAQDGAWHGDTVSGTGDGGGGGAGAGQLEDAQWGAGGAQGIAYGFGAPAGAAQSSQQGGDGGGANVGPLTGVAEEYYGGPRFGSLYGHSDGAVIVKLS